MILNQKDLHCIARILQSVLFTEGEIFYACEKYCQYREQCSKEYGAGKTLYFINEVRPKLQDITGVYLGMDAHNIDEKFLLESEQIRKKSENQQ